MSFNSTPSSERLHISFFGLRNAGKSSLVNAVTGQSLSVVSDVKGTTTDPVKKSMELLPLGPVVIIDTPGFDDVGALGELRVKRTKEIFSKTDIAVLVTDCTQAFSESENALIESFKNSNIPYIIALNKSDLTNNRHETKENEIYTSAVTGDNIYELKDLIAKLSKKQSAEKFILKDLVKAGDMILLVVPIDKAAPKGRLILPQQMTIREILDIGAVAITCQDTALKQTLSLLKDKPELVITDSQVFKNVEENIPADVPLTSFSILMARYKGELKALVTGAKKLAELKDGERVLISEGCTHHRQCNDIGSVKLPLWIQNYTNAKIDFDFSSGGEFPDDLSPYSLVVHCGGCMLNEKEMKNRIQRCKHQGVPIVNYGVAIAQMHSIFNRSIDIFPEIL